MYTKKKLWKMKKFNKIVSLLLVVLIIHINATMCIGVPIKVKEGTSVYVTVNENKPSKNTVSGEKIKAKIADDVKVDNTVVFKKDDNALLYVSDVKSNGFLGNAGEILLFGATVYDNKGSKHSSEVYYKIAGNDKTYPKVLMTTGLLIWPLLLFGFVRGGHAKIPQKYPIEVRIKNDFIY